jgi:hypothetical protein
MVAKFAIHRLNTKVGASTNTFDFWFLAPPDAYTGIATECGITKINETDIGNLMPLCKVEALLKSKASVRRKLRIKVGTKFKYKSVVVAASKVATFDDDILGKTVGGGTVETVVTPLNASYS